MQSIRFLILALLIGSLWSSCKLLEKNLENALNNADTQAQLEKITREVVHNAIYQAAQDSTLGPLKEQLAQVLDSLQLTADATAQQLVDNLLGAKTNELLSMQMDSMRQKFKLLLQDTDQFLEDDISPFIKNAILKELELSLKSWLLTLQSALASQEMQQSLNQFRQYLSAELDSLLNASSNSLAANLDEFLLPRLDSMFVNLDTFSSDTEKKANSLLGRILLGLVGLVLLGALAYQIVWKSRYRRIIEIITRNIDEISEQETYDDLVHNVQKEVAQAQLKKPLDDLLRKQKLLEQPEWKSKDKQVVELLLRQLTKHGDKPESDEDEVVKELYESAEKKGLREHLKSILRRKE